MSKNSLDAVDELLDFEHYAKCSVDTCDDPDCVFCQENDPDAAFWDSFFSEPEEPVLYTLHVPPADPNSPTDQVIQSEHFLPFSILKDE